jgi:hypothetical protein
MARVPRDRWTGATVDHFLKEAPAELEEDAVGLWQIVSAGKYDFRLQGEALQEFVRRYLRGLLERRAKPVKVWAGGPTYWRVVYDFGSTPRRIEKAVMAAWLASGRDPDVHDVWFAVRKVYDQPRRPYRPPIRPRPFIPPR